MISRALAHGVLAAALLALAAVPGCKGANPTNPSQGGTPMSLTVRSTAFQEGQPIPMKYTGEGKDVSPALEWDAPPAGTKSLALICEDPDAPKGTWTHWVLYNLPADRREVSEDVARERKLPDGSEQGTNDFDKVGYNGPKPPPGKVHHYQFKLYALDTRLDLQPGATRKRLLDAVQGHILGEGQLTGTYERKK